MTESVNPAPKPRVLSARRLALLASASPASAPTVLFGGAELRSDDADLALAQNLSPEAQDRAAAGRLCRHRREGEAGGHLGARQGRRPAPR